MEKAASPYRVHIETFGCQMNEYDTELVRSLLKAEGFTFTEDRERADVILMNTCAIREHAHHKVYGRLADLKAVMRGCDNFCTFCVVPYTRGRERSRDPYGIIREAEHLASRGYKQVTLLGQNVNSYRFEAREGARTWDFARLITAVADLPGIERV